MQVKHGLHNHLELLQLHLFVAACLYSWCVNDMHKAVGILAFVCCFRLGAGSWLRELPNQILQDIVRLCVPQESCFVCFRGS